MRIGIGGLRLTTRRGGGGAPVDPTASTLSYFDGNVSFDVTATATGQYADGSYWAVGEVTDMDPAFAADLTRTLTDTTTVDADAHGWMVNPGSAAAWKAGDMSTLALRQAANYGTGASAEAQGYDGFALTNLAYDATQRPALPITSGTVVKAKSIITGLSTTARPALEYAAVLTLVSSAPATGSIRPPIARADKTPILNTSQLDLSPLRNLDVSGFTHSLPTYAQALSYLASTDDQSVTSNVARRNTMAANGSGQSEYHGDISQEWSWVMLAMHTNAYTTEQKTALAIQIGKIAGDIAARVNEGGIYQANGGHSHGRLPLLAFAAELFDSAYLRDACAITAANAISNVTLAGASVYGDLGQLYYVTQAHIDGSTGASYPMPQAALGYPAWASQASIHTGISTGSILSTANALGNYHANDGPLGTEAAYQEIVGKSLAGFSLALRLMQSVAPAVPQLYHDYADRWIGFEVSDLYAFPDATLVKPATHLTADWVREAYAAFSALVSVWTPPAPVISALILGQSEPEYLFNANIAYRQITQPTPGDGNLIVVTQGAVDAAPVRTVVNSTTVAAGQVNPAMAALSAWLAHVRPGRTFIVGDGAVGGTSRYALADDAATTRKWTDLTSVVDLIEAETGLPMTAMIECWYNSDAASISNFRPSFWPLYFGRTGADGAFTLGNTNPDATNTAPVFDNCFWDGAASVDAKGRGIFARSDTLWRVLTPMPFCDGPVDPDPEATNFDNTLRLSETRRQTMHDLAANALTESVGLKVGPSAHLTDFGGDIHPVVDDPDGQILFMWPFAFRIAELAGLTVEEPEIVDIEGPEDGTYADLVVSLPNGGNLTTLRAFRAEAAPVPEPPHYQPVMGIEIDRGGTRRPVYKEAETSYPISHRGVVTITDAGSGSPRRGRARITPETPFEFGNSLSYLRGQANAMLLEPRDVTAKVYKNMLIEHVPGWYDSGATYPCPGVAVKPYQAELQTLVPAPAFTPQSTSFNGLTSSLENTSLSIAGGSEGTFAAWLYYDEATWNSPTGTVFELRAGSTVCLRLHTASSGRCSFNLGGATLFTTTPTNAFQVGRWHHVAVSWKAGSGAWYQLSIDGAAPLTGADLTSATLIINGTITRAYVSGGTTRWPGDLAYIYCNVTEALDLSVEANRQKFILAGEPVNLGANGSLVTGTQPAFYFDGGASMANLGSGGSLTATDLTAGTAPALP